MDGSVATVSFCFSCLYCLLFEVLYLLQLFIYLFIYLFFISVNVYFSFVSNSLAYLTIPQNNGKMKINWDKKNLLEHICVYFLFIIFPWSLIWIHTCLISKQHPLMMMMMMIIVIIVILLIVLLLLLLLLLLLKLLSSSSFFCVIECFLTGVQPFVFLGKPFIRSRPSNRPAVLLLLSFLYFFICPLSFNPFSFYIRFLIRSVVVRFDEVLLPIFCL